MSDEEYGEEVWKIDFDTVLSPYERKPIDWRVFILAMYITICACRIIHKLLRWKHSILSFYSFPLPLSLSLPRSFNRSHFYIVRFCLSLRILTRKFVDKFKWIIIKKKYYANLLTSTYPLINSSVSIFISTKNVIKMKCWCYLKQSTLTSNRDHLNALERTETKKNSADFKTVSPFRSKCSWQLRVPKLNEIKFKTNH